MGTSWLLPWPRMLRSFRRGDHGNLPANQLGRQVGKSIHLILGPTIVDRHVLALDIAVFFEALAKCAHNERHERQAMPG